MRARLLKIGLVLTAVAAVLTGAEASRKGLVTGWASKRISEELISVWLSGHSGAKVRPLMVVFYHGQPRWHFKQWRADFTQNRSPGTLKLAGGGIEIRLRADIEYRTVTVQGEQFSRREHNVFLVLNADAEPAARRVVPLGRYKLESDGESPLPISLLDANPKLRERLEAETGD